MSYELSHNVHAQQIYERARDSQRYWEKLAKKRLILMNKKTEQIKQLKKELKEEE